MTNKIFLIGIMAAIVAVLFIPTSAFAVGTSYTTLITAEGTDNTLNYTDAGNSSKDQVTSNTFVTEVQPIYGFSCTGPTPNSKSTSPLVGATYSVTVYNEGNKSDEYSYSAGTPGDGWSAEVDKAGSGAVSEGGNDSFTLTVTPPDGAVDGAWKAVNANISTSSSPVGIYVGANANTYGGLASTSRGSTTTVVTGVMKMTRTATVDAPAAYLTGGGHQHDAVPGAVITFSILVTNEGTAAATKVIVLDKVPANTDGLDVGSTEAAHITRTAGAALPSGWTAYYTASTEPDKGYQKQLGTEWITVESFLIPSSTAFVKFEKASVSSIATEKLTWGVTIK